MKYTAHETVVLDTGALVGPGTFIWHFSHICSGAQIGRDCSLGQGVYVAGTSRIGNGCKIQNNVSIYDGVILEDEVFCGPSAVFTNVFNPRAAVTRKHEYRRTLIKKGATLGANSTIVCGVTIGEYAFVGAGAVVTCDIAPYATFAGVPAKQIGWMTQIGEKINLPIEGSGTHFCEKTGLTYRLVGTSMTVSN